MTPIEEKPYKSYAKAESQDLEINKKIISQFTQRSMVHGLSQDLANDLCWLTSCETVLLF